MRNLWYVICVKIDIFLTVWSWRLQSKNFYDGVLTGFFLFMAFFALASGVMK